MSAAVLYAQDPDDPTKLIPVLVDGSGALATTGGDGGGGGGTVDQGEAGSSAWLVTGPLTNEQLRASAVPVSGPLTNAQLTAVTGTAASTSLTTDPTLAGQTLTALLRGILSEMQTQTALLTTIASNTTPAA